MARKNNTNLSTLHIGLMFIIGVLLVMLTVVVSGNQQNLQSDAAGKGGGPTYIGGNIVLNEDPSNLSMDSTVTFDTVVPKLKGNEYPMVYVACYQDGKVVYGQLDHPDVTFILGGGWSPWRDVGGPATCRAELLVYGGQEKGHSIITFLAETPTFEAQGQ